MSSSHLTRKDLKTDAIASEVQHGVEVVAAHKSQVFRYGAAALVLIAGYAGYSFYSSHQAAAREEALWQARRAFSANRRPNCPAGGDDFRHRGAKGQSRSRGLHQTR
ncbi:MAG: hypothetical protein WDO18_16020 [Acidobacteriota bacterium]